MTADVGQQSAPLLVQWLGATSGVFALLGAAMGIGDARRRLTDLERRAGAIDEKLTVVDDLRVDMGAVKAQVTLINGKVDDIKGDVKTLVSNAITRNDPDPSRRGAR